MSNLWTARWTGAFLLWSVTVLMGDARCWADEGEQVKAAFFEPTREYATAPLWVWNDDLTAQQIRETLQDLAGQQVKQAFVHPRPGSDDALPVGRVVSTCGRSRLDEAERLDMNLWIYDENSYPSGFRRWLGAGTDAGIARAGSAMGRSPGARRAVDGRSGRLPTDRGRI